MTKDEYSCRCGAEFCYNCGVRWKECSCSVWDEARLLLRENRMINRAQHECGHPGWDRVYDPHVCERCTERMPHYTFQCEECALRVCRRCRLNRRR